MPKARVLFYCQHLLGIGHLSRSLALVKGCLQAGLAVDFVQGGPDLGRSSLPDNDFRLIALPPLLMEEETSQLYDPAHGRTVEAIFCDRARRLTELARSTSYAAIVTELFPFGRGKFKTEVLSLLSQVRQMNPAVVRVSSVRDILVGKDLDGTWESKIIKLLRENFDAVLVHSDPKVIAFEETFARALDIQDLLHYTGFVTEGDPPPRTGPRRREVLVSLGGGVVGDELALAVLAVANHFPDVVFRFFLGPYASSTLTAEIAKASAVGVNLRVENFLPVKKFEEELARSGLSISLAGYNTLMDLLVTQTPALVLPYDRNHEQALRARRLESLGLLTVLTRADLTPDRLGAHLTRSLLRLPPAIDIRIHGAIESARQLRSWIDGRETLSRTARSSIAIGASRSKG